VALAKTLAANMAEAQNVTAIALVKSLALIIMVCVLQ
jgi:hypothetical protein